MKDKQCCLCPFVGKMWRSHLKKTYCKSCWLKIKPSNELKSSGKVIHQNKEIKPLKRSKPPRKVSEKQAKINKAYTVLREDFLKRHPECMVLSLHCTGISTTIHHMIGRGKRTNDTTEWLACCMSCHEKIEREPEWAKKYGYSKSRLEI